MDRKAAASENVEHKHDAIVKPEAKVDERTSSVFAILNSEFAERGDW